MAHTQEDSHPDDSPENVIPNRVLLFLVEGTSTLREYPGDEEMIRYLHQKIPSQELDALRQGVTLAMHCANGIYECTLNTENGDIYITAPANLKPKSIHVNFKDYPFPGEEHLMGFLQERLTKRYQIGTHLKLNFRDKEVFYEIGLLPARSIEGTQESVRKALEASLTPA